MSSSLGCRKDRHKVLPRFLRETMAGRWPQTAFRRVNQIQNHKLQLSEKKKRTHNFSWVVFHQTIWKICASPSNWIIMKAQGSGWTWKIFELPPPPIYNKGTCFFVARASFSLSKSSLQRRWGRRLYMSVSFIQAWRGDRNEGITRRQTRWWREVDRSQCALLLHLDEKRLKMMTFLEGMTCLQFVKKAKLVPSKRSKVKSCFSSCKPGGLCVKIIFSHLSECCIKL